MQVTLVLILLQLSNLGNVIHAFSSFTHSPSSMITVRRTSSLSMVVQLPFDKIEQDFQAFTRRVTANHFLPRKSTEAALTPNKKISNRVISKSSDLPPMHVINASKIVRGGTDGAKTVYLGPNDKEEDSNVFRLTVEKLAFWILLLII